LKTSLPKDLPSEGCNSNHPFHLFTFEEDSSNFKVELLPVVYVPFVWDMEDMYGASKKLRQFSGVISTIQLDDFIQEFNTWCDM